MSGKATAEKFAASWGLRDVNLLKTTPIPNDEIGSYGIKVGFVCDVLALVCHIICDKSDLRSSIVQKGK